MSADDLVIQGSRATADMILTQFSWNVLSTQWHRKPMQQKSRYWHAYLRTWWHHQMETFSALLAICAGNSPVLGEFPAQRPVMRSFDVFFHLRLNKRLSKQSWGCWFEMLLRPLWRHCNGIFQFQHHKGSKAFIMVLDGTFGWKSIGIICHSGLLSCSKH